MSPSLNPQSSRPSATTSRRRQIKTKRNYIDGVTPKPANKANAIRSPVFSDDSTRYLDSSTSNSPPPSSSNTYIGIGQIASPWPTYGFIGPSLRTVSPTITYTRPPSNRPAATSWSWPADPMSCLLHCCC
jgi:hypothetical protein